VGNSEFFRDVIFLIEADGFNAQAYIVYSLIEALLNLKEPPSDWGAFAFSHSINSIRKAYQGSVVLIMRIDTAKQTKKLKWETMLA
jgi:hypothetical protein